MVASDLELVYATYEGPMTIFMHFFEVRRAFNVFEVRSSYRLFYLCGAFNKASDSYNIFEVRSAFGFFKFCSAFNAFEVRSALGVIAW
jgi:hypothetical protein